MVVGGAFVARARPIAVDPEFQKWISEEVKDVDKSKVDGDKKRGLLLIE